MSKILTLNNNPQKPIEERFEDLKFMFVGILQSLTDQIFDVDNEKDFEQRFKPDIEKTGRIMKAAFDRGVLPGEIINDPETQKQLSHIPIDIRRLYDVINNIQKLKLV
ncbi:MAG: hypothetical protein EHM58_04440 [Ignavibacteriae bacterium]|nr:MAG: hypothetical protein EHM58_04440 [Ignavibacteriota bacterium]